MPMGFGAILVNLPLSSATEVLETLFSAGIANELFPLLLFIGIGAMIDFGPLLSNPRAAALRRGGAVRHFLYADCGPGLRLRPEGRGGHRHHRRGGRAHLHSGGQRIRQQISGGHYGGGLFLHGAGAHCAAPLHQTDYYPEGTQDSHGIQSRRAFPKPHGFSSPLS